MAALDFDNSPNTESSVSTGDITWKLSKNAGDGTPIWYATTDATQVIHVGVNPPPTPRPGQMWWCSDTAAEGGGRLYVYFDDVWVDTSLPGGGQGDDFLSKTEDDTAAGSITFQDVTNHQGGVKLSGGNRDTIGCGLTKTNLGGRGVYLTIGDLSRDGGALYGWSTQLDDDTITIDSDQTFNIYDSDLITGLDCSFVGFRASYANLSGSVPEFKGFTVIGSGRDNIDDVKGYYSDINIKAGKERYNFYAAGSAPSKFVGAVYINADIDQNFASTSPGGLKIHTGSNAANNSRLEIKGSWRADGSNNLAISFTSPTSDSDDTPQLRGAIRIYNDKIGISGLQGGPLMIDEGADARLVTTTEAITNASAVVQQLQPVKINGTRHGFAAAALEPVFAEAVAGSAGATEAVGTYVDADGIEETGVEEPEAIPFGATWTQTGTRDIYQGVDQTKLIPLLTKALQEALNRIEALESNEVVDDATDSALLTLVANLATRVSALEGA